MAQEYIGRFEIIAYLGGGGMADVYHAHDPDFPRDVAIKLIRPEYVHVADFLTRFQQEASIIAALEHDAIVPVHELGEHDNRPYLVMRHMVGGSLSQRIEQEPLAVSEVMRLFDRIAPAVDVAHARGIVHRDLKPDNILFDQYDKAFIADFGIAKVMHSTTELTGTGSLIGTPAYMSPEQIQDRGEVDHRSDLYALGVILYECLTGEMPFKVDSSVGYFSAHLNDPVPDIRDVRPDLPHAFTSVIYRAMAKDKDERYQSAADLSADVVRASESDVYDETFDTPPGDPPSGRRIPLALIGGGAVIVLIVGLLLSGVLSGGGQSDDTEPQVSVSQAVDQPTSTVEQEATEQPPPTLHPTATENPLLAALADAGRILFAASLNGNNDIYVMRADGRDRKRLTIDAAVDGAPDWSPDGGKIVFDSERDGDFDIYLMDADGSNLTQLIDSEGNDFQSNWSSDGQHIAFASNRDGDYDIYVMDIDSSNLRQLTDDPGPDYEPAWSPDDSKIVFSSARNGNWDVYMMDPNGENVVRLTFDPDDDLSPEWSPDGSRITYASNTVAPNTSQLGMIDVETRERTFLTPVFSSTLLQNSWSPDGQYIVFSLGVSADACQLYVMRSDGSDMVRITTGSGGYYFPVWEPAP